MSSFEHESEQARYWREDAGPRWVAVQEQADAQLRPVGDAAMDAARIRPGDRVLDVGAGCGDTTLELARRTGPGGHVHAVDVSTVMLDRARERARAAGLANVSFQLADAGADAIEGAPYDVAFSRFGLMFFPDPPAAFRKLRESLVPGGRLAACTWRSREENEWFTAPARAAARFLDIPAPQDPHGPGPFGLFDRDRTLGILQAAGWRDVSVQPFDAAMRIGGAAALGEAVEFLLRLGPVGAALASAEPLVRTRVEAAVRDALAPHAGKDGVVMTGAAWIVTATA